MKHIEIKHKSKVFLTAVDDSDYNVISQYNWKLDGKGYVKRSCKVGGNWIAIYMHREVMKAKKGQVIDHKNRNPLDNRKENLRFCTQRQNLMNRRSDLKNKSGYKGVFYHTKDKAWRAKIGIDGKVMHIGNFRNVIDAAKAYNEAAKKYHGEFAFLNKV